MPSQIAMLVGVFAAALLVVGALITARRITARAKEEGRRDADGIVADARREAEARAQDLLAAAQEKAFASEEESDRRERDIDAREAQIETRARQRESELLALERQRKDVERRATALAADEERGLGHGTNR